MNDSHTKPKGLRYERLFPARPYENIHPVTRTARIAHADGRVVFEQKGVTSPDFWSQQAINFAAQKYFVRTDDVTECSVFDMVHGVAKTIADAGAEQGYFADAEGRDAFESDLKYLLIHQYGAFNSPVWFNVRRWHQYGIPGGPGNWAKNYTTGEIEQVDAAYTRPQCSACFIHTIQDSLVEPGGIADFLKAEMRLFKFGSGSGANFSALREKGGKLSPGGKASGLMSFLPVFDRAAGSVASGGTCLAPHQRVYTAEAGPVAVEQLARTNGGEFIALSYDPPARRYKAKRARAWLAGTKQVLRITTDKGVFELSHDHPFKLSTGEYRLASALRPGNSLFPCTLDLQHGHLRVHLRDGRKGREFLHRLVACDVMGQDLEGLVVHHIDEDRFNNHPTNLYVTTQSEHARGHCADRVAEGTHLFQTRVFPKHGSTNGMHADSPFWQDAERATAYRAVQAEILAQSGRAAGMQECAAEQKMLNTAYRILNAGYSIDTFEAYVTGRKAVVGRIASLRTLKRQINNRFGSFEAFVKEVAAQNHRVLSVAVVGEMPVYDVEVSCPTADDKSPDTGHNFVIWSDDSRTGSGVVVANSRRAAKMVVVNIDHPEIEEFISWKMEEEKKAQALIRAGYSDGMEGEAYSTVTGQNANNSVRVTDAFMRAVEQDEPFNLTSRVDGRVVKTVRARELWDSISHAAWFCADPGIQFDDTFNRWNTTPNGGRINATNPCVTGDTQVATANGWRPIAELTREPVSVVGSDGVLHEIAPAFKTGEKRVYRLRTRSGFELKLTADHRVQVVGRGDIAASDLTVDDRVQLGTVPFGSSQIQPDAAEFLGLVAGDGCLSGGTVSLTLHPAERVIAERAAAWINDLKIESNATWNAGRPVSVRQPQATCRVCTSYGPVVDLVRRYLIAERGSEKKAFTSEVFALDRSSVAQVLRGLFTADGTVGHYGEKSHYIGLDSISLELLQQVQLLLLGFGIKAKIYRNRRAMGQTTAILPDGKGGQQSYAVQQIHSLRISHTGRVIFAQAIGFCAGSPKAEALEALNQNVDAYRDDWSDRVASVEYLGVEPVYDLTEPATSHFVANGLVVHNCSEYAHLDDSACNLASLNLVRFLDPDVGGFDFDRFRLACSVFIIAQDILVGFSSYPTKAIAEGANNYRQLGLGYANLGALLMLTGRPYDSEAGRRLAQQITSVMGAAATLQSADLAEAMGPFQGYDNDKAGVEQVINLHRHEAQKAGAYAGLWDLAANRVAQQGLRNAQLTLLAPTGTISFLMDCATTGIEPLLSHVQYKQLAGGGSVRIVSPVTRRALVALGYGATTLEAICAHVEAHGAIEDAPGLNPEHIAVFDTALSAKPEGRVISPDGHLQMMAAVQPFLSGAISKTVNLPQTTTPAEVGAYYLKAWKLGIKALAIYRDGCKSAQPVTTTEKGATPEKEVPVVQMIPTPAQRKLPSVRRGVTWAIRLDGHKVYLRSGEYADGRLGEVFVDLAKEGSTLGGLVGMWAKSLSLGLQYGVPLEKYVEAFTHTRFEPFGSVGDHPTVKRATSIVDLVMRVLAVHYLGRMDLQHVQEDTVEVVVKQESSTAVTGDAPPCRTCGTITVRTGACYTCPACGTSGGCG